MCDSVCVCVCVRVCDQKFDESNVGNSTSVISEMALGIISKKALLDFDFYKGASTRRFFLRERLACCRLPNKTYKVIYIYVYIYIYICMCVDWQKNR